MSMMKTLEDYYKSGASSKTQKTLVLWFWDSNYHMGFSHFPVIYMKSWGKNSKTAEFKKSKMSSPTDTTFNTLN